MSRIRKYVREARAVLEGMDQAVGAIGSMGLQMFKSWELPKGTPVVYFAGKGKRITGKYLGFNRTPNGSGRGHELELADGTRVFQPRAAGKRNETGTWRPASEVK